MPYGKYVPPVLGDPSRVGRSLPYRDLPLRSGSPSTVVISLHGRYVFFHTSLASLKYYPISDVRTQTSRLVCTNTERLVVHACAIEHHEHPRHERLPSSYCRVHAPLHTAVCMPSHAPSMFRLECRIAFYLLRPAAV